MKFNPDIRHRRSARLKGYDYSKPGWYFVTICTWKKEPFLGKIENGNIILSEVGRVVYKHWMEIPEHFLSISLDELVIMPNHLHGILRIDEVDPNVGVQYIEPLQKRQTHQYQHIISQSIGSIIRAFKASVTRHCRRNDLDFAWQRNFYDHIIRGDKQLHAIREYIQNNPLNWEWDTESNSFLKKSPYTQSGHGDSKAQPSTSGLTGLTIV